MNNPSMELPKRMSQVAEQIQIMESKLCQLDESVSALKARLSAVLPEQALKEAKPNLVHERVVVLADKIRSMQEGLLLSIDEINWIVSSLEL